jgi:hypothetical protein
MGPSALRLWLPTKSFRASSWYCVSLEGHWGLTLLTEEQHGSGIFHIRNNTITAQSTHTLSTNPPHPVHSTLFCFSIYATLQLHLQSWNRYAEVSTQCISPARHAISWSRSDCGLSVAVLDRIKNDITRNSATSMLRAIIAIMSNAARLPNSRNKKRRVEARSRPCDWEKGSCQCRNLEQRSCGKIQVFRTCLYAFYMSHVSSPHLSVTPTLRRVGITRRLFHFPLPRYFHRPFCCLPYTSLWPPHSRHGRRRQLVLSLSPQIGRILLFHIERELDNRPEPVLFVQRLTHSGRFHPAL